MTWFKVDDHLHSHRKAMRAGTEAMGLWVLAGSWSGAEESDGWVPAYVLTRLAGPGSDELADRLVAAGLWHADTVDGEDGYRFHTWDEYQPTRDALERRRTDTRERMRRARSQGGDVRKHDQHSAPAVREHNAGSAPAVTPTRPGPSRPKESVARKRATQLPDDFTPNDTNQRIAEERGLDLAAVVAQWSDFHRSKASTFADWHAALNTWLRREQPGLPGTAAAAVRQRPPTNAQCDDPTPHDRHPHGDARNRYACAGVPA